MRTLITSLIIVLVLSSCGSDVSPEIQKRAHEKFLKYFNDNDPFTIFYQKNLDKLVRIEIVEFHPLKKVYHHPIPLIIVGGLNRNYHYHYTFPALDPTANVPDSIVEAYSAFRTEFPNLKDSSQIENIRNYLKDVEAPLAGYKNKITVRIVKEASSEIETIFLKYHLDLSVWMLSTEDNEGKKWYNSL